MKNLTVGFFFSTLILLTASCSKTNDPAANKPTKCFLLKYTYSDGSFSRELTFTFNSNDQVVKMNGTASNGFSGEGDFTYDSQSNTIKMAGNFLAPSNDYEIYTINAKNLIIRYERFSPTGSLNYKTEYTYNSFDQETSKTNFYYDQGNAIKSGSSTFEYVTTSSKVYSLEKQFDSNDQLTATVEYEYDEKMAPFSSLSFVNQTVYNITKATKKDASGTVLYIETITYEYNELGYPTKSVSNLNESKSPVETTRTYTYNCK